MSYKTISKFGNKEESEPNPLPKINTVPDKQYLASNNKLLVVNIHSHWCGPCKIVSPQFNELYKKYNIPGVCVLATENVDLRLSPSVTVVPTFQYFYNGSLDSVITGADITQVEGKIIQLLQQIQVDTERAKASVEAVPNNPPKEKPLVNLPPQLQKQFQYKLPERPTVGTELPSENNGMMSLPAGESLQSSNEGFQHALNTRHNQYHEAPPQLPMSLPIRRKM